MSSASSRPEATTLAPGSGLAGWRLLLDPATPPAASLPDLRGFAQRLAQLVGPAQAAAALAPARAAWGLELLPPEQVAQARLLAKRARHHQLAALRLLAADNIEGVVLKGFDFAHRLYDDPLDRIGEDLDLLLRPADWPAALALLQRAGWRVGQSRLPAWGSITRASAAPLLSPDGATQLDLHRAADEWPLERALPTAALFASAETFACEGLLLRAPRPADSLLLLVSNLGKDKFGPFAVRKLIDAARLLQRHAPDPAALTARARASQLGRPLDTLCGLLRRLGRPLPGWPEAPAGPTFERLLADLRELRFTAPGGLALLRREFALAADWRVALGRNAHRLRGLLRPGPRR